MSKLALYSVLAAAGSAGVVAVGVATGVMNWPGAESTPATPPAAVEKVADPAPGTPAADPVPAPVVEGTDDATAGDPASEVVDTDLAGADDKVAEDTVTDVASSDDKVSDVAVTDVAASDDKTTDDVVADDKASDNTIAEESITPAPAPAEQIAAAPEPETETRDAAAIDEPDPEVSPPETAEAPQPAQPEFDLVRAETDGSALIAGGGEPGAMVEVLVNGEPATELAIGRDGKFSAFVDLPADGSGSVLSLRMRVQGREVLSRNDVIVTPAVMQAADAASAPEAVPQPLDRAPSAPGAAGVSDAPGARAAGSAAPDVPRATGAEAVAAAPGAPDPNAVAVPVPRAGDAPQALAPRDAGQSGAAPALTASIGGSARGSGQPPAAPEAATAGVSPETLGTDAPVPVRTGGAAPAAPEGAVADSPAAVSVAAGIDTAAPEGAEVASRALQGGASAGAAPERMAAAAEAPEAGTEGPGGLAAPQPDPEAATPGQVAPPPVTAARDLPETQTPPERVRKPAILVSGPSGVEVLEQAPLAPGDVALDSISYDGQGDVLISGRGEDEAFVRIYLDNTPVTISRIEEDGRWRVELPQVDTGTYTLRVDQIDESGAVIARVESPFLRESAEALAEATGRGAGPITSVVVQPGNTLWGISDRRYGKGWQYVRIYEANLDRIRDPDLIYPGQIFDLPGE